jgi:triacylglycerol esterase/lipase EstA (alpha/beta hydrolase family)
VIFVALFACTGASTVVTGDSDSDTPVDTDLHACAEAGRVEGEPIIDGPVSGTRERCTSVVHAGAGAGGSTLEADITWSGALPPRIRATDPAGRVLLPWESATTASFEVATSGEVYVELAAANPGADATDYTLSLTCIARCDRGFTRYPLVFVHGLGGGGAVGGADYFYGVRDDLAARGYVVYDPTVPAFAGSEDRGDALAPQIDAILAATGARKVDLIGHSQGGLDSRYLVSALGYGDRVGAIVTVGTPHAGTPVADVLTGAVQIPGVDAGMIDAGAAAFGALYGLDADSASLTASMAFLTTENMAVFDAANPDDERVYYASWAGHSCGTLEPECQAAHGGEVVDPLFETLYIINWLDGLASDGLVPVDSAHHGDFRGEIDADHADEIGAFADTDNPAFDHLVFYRSEAERLASMGY